MIGTSEQMQNHRKPPPSYSHAYLLTLLRGKQLASDRGWSSNGHPSNLKEGAWRFTWTMDYGLWRGHAPRMRRHLSRRGEESKTDRDAKIWVNLCQNAFRNAADGRWNLLAWEICVWHTGWKVNRNLWFGVGHGVIQQ